MSLLSVWPCESTKRCLAIQKGFEISNRRSSFSSFYVVTIALRTGLFHVSSGDVEQGTEFQLAEGMQTRKDRHDWPLHLGRSVIDEYGFPRATIMTNEQRCKISDQLIRFFFSPTKFTFSPTLSLFRQVGISFSPSGVSYLPVSTFACLRQSSSISAIR